MSVDQVETPASSVVEVPPKTEGSEEASPVAPEEQQPEILEIEVELPHEPYKVKVPVSLSETLQDIRQSITENPFTYFYSCFYLEHEGVRLNDYQEIATIPNLIATPQLKLREDVYTERESRIHIMRLRELLKGYQSPCGRYGYDENISVFHAIVPSAVVSKKKKKKADKPESYETLTNTSFEEYNFEETKPSLLSYCPSDSITTPPKCLRQVTLSGWNPVTPIRKLAGDLLYLTITTLENKVFEITSSASGYFVNNSTTDTFDPSRKAPVHNMQAHSLVQLLQYLSPGFRTNMTKIQQNLLNSEMLQLIQVATPYVNHPWITTPRTPAFDACRPCEVFLTAGANGSDSLHDWNEDIQSQRELPRSLLQERILRDRCLSKVYADFFDACVQAAYSVAEGNIVPINPNESADSHMYVYNNLFISKTFDGLNQFDSYGGEEAAYVAASKDIIGVRLLNQLDIEGIYTMGSCLVDYRGERYVVQCVIPGLFRMQEMIQYGTTDCGTTIFDDKKFHELTGKLVDILHLSPHDVKDASGKTFHLNTSLDVKGICGGEGRHYLVDLHRLNPVDIVFQESECVERDGLKAYPHKMTLIRRELVEIFYASKLKAWREEKNKLKEEQKEENGQEEDQSGEELKKENGQEEDQSGEEQNELDDADFDYSLNPDAFTDLVKDTDPADEERVRECSAYIGKVVLPTFVKEMASHVFSPVDSSALTKVLHTRGINMRYLGKIYELLSQEDGSKLASSKRVFLIEMVLRSCKRLLRRFLREIPGSFSIDCVAHFLNCLFASKDDDPKPTQQSEYGYSSLTPQLLKDMILETVATRFRFPLTMELLDSIPHLTLLRELCIVVGIQLLARDYCLDGPLPEVPRTNGTPTGPLTRFRPADILAIVPKIKHTLPILNYPEELLETGRQTVVQGDRQLGLDYLTESITIFEQVFGPISPDTAQCYSNVATVHFHLNSPKVAEELQKKAVISYERCMGLDHPDTLQALIQYGFYLNGVGRLEDGLKVIRFALDKWYPLYSEYNLDIAYANHNLGAIFQKLNRHETALKFFKRASAVYETLLGPSHVSTAGCYSAIARSQNYLRDFKAAIASEKLANAVFAQTLGEDNVNTLRSSQALQDYTSNAVHSAREVAYEKSPEYRELKLRVQETIKREKEKREAETISSRGHLPVEDLVKFIDGTETKPKKSTQGTETKSQKSSRRTKKKSAAK